MLLDQFPVCSALPHQTGDVSPALLASPLLQSGGAGVFQGVLDEAGRQALLSEALGLLPGALESRVDVPDTHEGRGGTPARKFLSAPGGPVQDAFYTAPWMITFLQQVTGLPVEPTGERGTYTFYVRSGDYLALHRDVERCDLAVITCLHDDSVTEAGGGTLRIYPHHLNQPLSAVRAQPIGFVNVQLLPGHTAVLYGGVIPHEVLPVAPRQQRIVSVLCYHVRC